MPRRARLILPEIPLHIIQRGNNRSVCFYAEDRFSVLSRLAGTRRARHQLCHPRLLSDEQPRSPAAQCAQPERPRRSHEDAGPARDKRQGGAATG